MKRVLVLFLTVVLLFLSALPAAANTVSITAVPAEGGTVSGGGTYEPDAAATLVAAPNDGFRFIGWYEDDTLRSQDLTYPIPVFSNRTFEARFEPAGDGRSVTRTFAVTYDANGGTGEPQAQSKTEGQPLTLSAVRPARQGNWRFLGWHDTRLEDNAATQPRYPRGQNNVYTADGDITLYAAWATGTGVPSRPIPLLAVFGVFMLILGGGLLRKQKK
jgi:hypothetical protein